MPLLVLSQRRHLVPGDDEPRKLQHTIRNVSRRIKVSTHSMKSPSDKTSSHLLFPTAGMHKKHGRNSNGNTAGVNPKATQANGQAGGTVSGLLSGQAGSHGNGNSHGQGKAGGARSGKMAGTGKKNKAISSFNATRSGTGKGRSQGNGKSATNGKAGHGMTGKSHVGAFKKDGKRGNFNTGKKKGGIFGPDGSPTGSITGTSSHGKSGSSLLQFFGF
jgi:hypothetical protein